MTHARKMDIDQAIDTGMSLLGNLKDKPAEILDLAFQSDFPRRILAPHHVGLLAPPGSHAELFNVIKARGHLLSVLRSSVVTAELTKRFGKQVGVDIYLCRSLKTDTPKLEVFRVVEGLNAANIRAAIPHVLHVAYTPRETVDMETIYSSIIADGFEYVGGGINQNKLMSKEDAITVFYFRKRPPVEGIPKIELFLPGRHSPPPNAETTPAPVSVR
uniref:Uncharacterized protein n=1 Tax=Candidatus Kentrum sp. SD TaxID=2126332 RepID=A0A450YRD4_9GAMM|nr:MAG: hypothetical protein BECKSD772F_GA0070984_10359 [Candidatus Kentron sp. SD]VFK44093.1 MAG: hypothetical protein BECKSD772E_GA0070983_10339 [Candidatus Kentron sp. SD]VFK79107.1 MAG: hypothetical protein BECKSD772D_GA0070982_10369 [Candidatus Kentron sp. SD]